MQRVDYDGRQHRVYHAGRRHPEATRRQWRRLLREHAGTRPPRRWLDIGSGTGRFSVLLADAFDADVVGVEPSSAMRAEASRHSAHPRVAYRAGVADAIPEPDGSFGAALMSMVFHHLSDRDAAAVEIRRVLRPGSRLLLRTATRDSHLDSTFYRLFEGARRVDRARLPTLAELRAFGRSGGFVEQHHEVVRQVTDESLVAFRDRMNSRPFSTFELMREREIEAGFGRLALAIQRDASRPAFELVDLLVLGSPPR